MDGQARRLVSEATQCETTGARGSPARLTREPNLLPGLAGSTAVPVCAVLCRCTASHRIASHRLASNRASAGKRGGWRSWWWWAHPLRGQNAPAARFVGCTHARQQDNETTGLVRFGAKCSAVCKNASSSPGDAIRWGMRYCPMRLSSPVRHAGAQLAWQRWLRYPPPSVRGFVVTFNHELIN